VLDHRNSARDLELFGGHLGRLLDGVWLRLDLGLVFELGLLFGRLGLVFRELPILGGVHARVRLVERRVLLGRLRLGRIVVGKAIHRVSGVIGIPLDDLGGRVFE
jgi:hypothetical protein